MNIFVQLEAFLNEYTIAKHEISRIKMAINYIEYSDAILNSYILGSLLIIEIKKGNHLAYRLVLPKEEWTTNENYDSRAGVLPF